MNLFLRICVGIDELNYYFKIKAIIAVIYNERIIYSKILMAQKNKGLNLIVKSNNVQGNLGKNKNASQHDVKIPIFGIGGIGTGLSAPKAQL